LSTKRFSLVMHTARTFHSNHLVYLFPFAPFYTTQSSCLTVKQGRRPCTGNRSTSWGFMSLSSSKMVSCSGMAFSFFYIVVITMLCSVECWLSAVGCRLLAVSLGFF
jgi:hypothetical protein